MPEKKYVKRIGWVVQFKTTGRKQRWDSLWNPKVTHTKGSAIDEFDMNCKFYTIPQGIILRYNYLKRRNRARIEPVYVEVLDD